MLSEYEKDPDGETSGSLKEDGGGVAQGPDLAFGTPEGANPSTSTETDHQESRRFLDDDIPF